MLSAINIPKYIAPLEDFDWAGDKFIINQQLQILRLKVPLSLDDYYGRIAIEDKREINDAKHALFYYLRPVEIEINYNAFYL